jgi:16S rRNA (cytosine1402-N4)-methyltransferase
MEQEVRSNLHIPVLLNESIELLNVRKDGIYIDCTGGRGGHSELILKKLEGTGTLFCLDIDKEAIEFLEKKFKGVKNIKIIKGNFKDIKDILAKFKITGVDGIFADLGVSSPMLDNYDRGFSYHADSFLDMRMDREQKKNAYEVINSYSLNQLVNIFKKYGDIKNPFFVVKEILKKREEKEINTTAELVKIIKDSVS